MAENEPASVMVTVDPTRNHGRASITRNMTPLISAAGLLWAGDTVEEMQYEYDLLDTEAAIIKALAEDFRELAAQRSRTPPPTWVVHAALTLVLALGVAVAAGIAGLAWFLFHLAGAW